MFHKKSRKALEVPTSLIEIYTCTKKINVCSKILVDNNLCLRVVHGYMYVNYVALTNGVLSCENALISLWNNIIFVLWVRGPCGDNLHCVQIDTTEN